MRGDPSQTHQPPQNGTAHSGVLLSARAPRRKCTSQVHAPTSAAAACREPAARLPSPPASPPLPLSVTTPCSAPASSTRTRRAKEACSKAPAPASRSRTPTSRGRASLRLCVCGTLPSWGKAGVWSADVVFIFLAPGFLPVLNCLRVGSRAPTLCAAPFRRHPSGTEFDRTAPPVGRAPSREHPRGRERRAPCERGAALARGGASSGHAAHARRAGRLQEPPRRLVVIRRLVSGAGTQTRAARRGERGRKRASVGP